MEHRKAFELIQRDFAYGGITSDLVHQSYPLNGRILFGFLLLGSNICFVLLFAVKNAKEFDEYTQCVNVITGMMLFIFALLILIVKIKQLFEFIDGGNDLINISEFHMKSI